MKTLNDNPERQQTLFNTQKYVGKINCKLFYQKLVTGKIHQKQKFIFVKNIYLKMSKSGTEKMQIH